MRISFIVARLIQEVIKKIFFIMEPCESKVDFLNFFFRFPELRVLWHLSSLWK